MKTPITPIKIPKYIKDEIKRRTNNVSAWIREAILEKLSKKDQ